MLVDELGEAEVGELRAVALGDEDVLRLDVPVDDARVVGGLERIGGEREELGDALVVVGRELRQLAGVAQEVGEGALAFDELLGEVVDAVGFARVVDRDHAFVLDAAAGAGFALEELDGARTDAAGVDQLERDAAREAQLLRFPDDAHAALAEAADQAVVADGVAGFVVDGVAGAGRRGGAGAEEEALFPGEQRAYGV